ncbi:MAG: hypothetical protein K6L75_14530 [Cellvibrionaceae bacterium]
MLDITEADWKIFKSIREQAIETYCERCLAEYQEIIDRDESAHNRYLLMYRVVENLDKKMELIFRHLSRSKAILELIAIRGEKLADETLVSKLSPELQERTDPENRKW